MEQTDSSEAHDHIVFVTALDNKVISDRTAWLCDVADTGFSSPLHIVGEWEERVGTAGNASHLA